MSYYYPMMNGYDTGWGIGMMFLWFISFIIVVVVLARLFRGHETGLRHRNPLDIAKERYARGDITKEDFEQLKKDLK